MPVERKGEDPYRGSEKTKNELSIFLADAALGSVKYQGFMDSLNQSELNDRREMLINMEKGFPLPITDHGESDLRIVEKRISLIENEIQQKCMKLPGYFEAYHTVGFLFDQLGYDLYQEAKAKYKYKHEVENYVKVEWDQTCENLREDLQRRDPVFKPFFSHQ